MLANLIRNCIYYGKIFIYTYLYIYSYTYVEYWKEQKKTMYDVKNTQFCWHKTCKYTFFFGTDIQYSEYITFHSHQYHVIHNNWKSINLLFYSLGLKLSGIILHTQYINISTRKRYTIIIFPSYANKLQTFIVKLHTFARNLLPK